MTDITKIPAERDYFKLDSPDGRGGQKEISVVDYFKDTYNITVTKPRLPCVIYGKSNKIP